MSTIARAARSVVDFIESSRGAHVAFDSFVYFHATTGLTGYVMWNDPSGSDLDALCKLIEASLDHERHPTLIDGREIKSPPVRLFECMSRFFPPRRERFTAAVDALGLVRPPGIAGAAALGFFELVQAPYPIQSFESLAPTLEWLKQPAPEEQANELEVITASLHGSAPLLYRVRAQIRSRLQDPDVSAIAKEIGLSERTLNRRLSELDTTFTEEVGRERVEAAKTLLIETDSSVTEIAVSVGCPSLSALSVLFRRHAGTTPSDFRKASKT